MWPVGSGSDFSYFFGEIFRRNPWVFFFLLSRRLSDSRGFPASLRLFRFPWRRSLSLSLSLIPHFQTLRFSLTTGEKKKNDGVDLDPGPRATRNCRRRFRAGSRHPDPQKETVDFLCRIFTTGRGQREEVATVKIHRF